MILLFLAGTLSPTQANRLGFGIVLFDPTGLSVKYFIKKKLAVDGILGWNLSGGSDLWLFSDLLFQHFKIETGPRNSLNIYYGPGISIRLGSNPNMGARLIVGLEYFIPQTPLELFLELGPQIDLIPNTKADFTLGLGMRFFLNWKIKRVN